MKKFFIAIVALAAAVSCSNDDIISIDRQAIGFGNAFVENATRVDYSTEGALTKFNVYGIVTGTAGTVNIFNGNEVTQTKQNATDIGDTNTWWYAAGAAQYWIPGASYNFAAVVDATIGDTDVDTNGMPTKLHTIVDDATDGNMNLKDMLYAKASVAGAVVTDTYNTPVAFTFSHLLSKVHFTVTSNATDGYRHTITNITVANFESGTYTINGGTWSGTTAKDVAFAEIAQVTKATGAKSNADLLLVPNAATFNVTFTVDLYKGETKLGTETKTVAVDNDLVKGNSYNFTIECSVGNPIKFTVANDPTWPDTPTDVTVQ